MRFNPGRKKVPRDLERMLLNYWPFLSTTKVFLSCGCLEVSGRKHQRAVFGFWDSHCFLGFALFNSPVRHWAGHVRGRCSSSPFVKRGATGDKLLRLLRCFKGHCNQIIKRTKGVFNFVLSVLRPDSLQGTSKPLEVLYFS